jgi:hypothetical protein
LKYLCPVWVLNAFSEDIRALDRSLAQRFFLKFGRIFLEFGRNFLELNLLEHLNHL